MARRGRRSLALALALAGAATQASAQAVGAPARIEDAATPTGAGVVLHVRVGESTAVGALPPGDPGGAAPGPAAAGGRPQAVRLVFADGASAPASFEAETGYGVYAFRADLPTPGAWTLSSVLRRAARPDAPVVVGFTAQGPVRAPLRTDPAAPALAPADPVQPAQPGSTTPPTR